MYGKTRTAACACVIAAEIGITTRPTPADRLCGGNIDLPPEVLKASEGSFSF